jgi:hypothetical protein
MMMHADRNSRRAAKPRRHQPGHAGGVWQLFFFDPSGARVEIDFAAGETVEGQG